MGSASHVRRRNFVLAGTGALISGCGSIPFIKTRTSKPPTPEQTLDRYFAFLAARRYADARQMMTSAFQARLGQSGVATLLHSIQSAQVTDIVDAVTWANKLGANLTAPAANQREYLVTLKITPSSAGRTTWSDGTNRRFVDLLRQGNVWKIDAVSVSPGVLITGKSSKETNQNAVVLPALRLRLGREPVDRAIYTARQNALDRGAIPWAADPVQVIHRDGPSFGLHPGDTAKIAGRDVDPTTLAPRVKIVVHQGNAAYLVTLVQPIHAGDKGVWAITDVEPYEPLPT